MNVSGSDFRSKVGQAIGQPGRALESSEPLRIAPHYDYSGPHQDLPGTRIGLDLPRLLEGPGIPLGVLDKEGRMGEYRQSYDLPLEGGLLFEQGTPKVVDVARPGSTPQDWDPYEFMPRFVFDPQEDAYPVDPAFDGDSKLENNAPAVPNAPGFSYQDGVIGGRQGLSGGFVVSKKGDYTVLTYSFYFPTNKAGHYHTKDWSIAQVYLKPDKRGKLEPEYLYTSWHHGGTLAKWDDLKKDEQGRPVVEVGRGSHALVALGKHQEIPKGGLHIRGDGSAQLNGADLPYRLSMDAFQGNVKAARHLLPEQDAFKARLITMRYGQVGLDPILPQAFEREGGLDKGVAEKAMHAAERIQLRHQGPLGWLKAGVSAVKDWFAGL